MGNPFNGIGITGNQVYLYNGNNITGDTSLFSNNTHLLNVQDFGSFVSLGGAMFAYSEIITFSSTSLKSIDDAVFYQSKLETIVAPLLETAKNASFGNSRLTSINLPNLKTSGDFCFNDTYYVSSINLPLLNTAQFMGFRQCGRFGGLLSVVNLPSLTSITNDSCFLACTTVQTFNLPLLQTVGYDCFRQCTSVTTFNLPSVTNLGGDCSSDNNVFTSIINKTITLTVPSALMTCNGGFPDYDIQILVANNNVTIIQV